MVALEGSNRHALKKQRREERERARIEQRVTQQASHSSRKTKKYLLFGLGTALILGLLIFFFTSSAGQPGPYDTFAQCLTEKGVVMYGAYWCPHCANQKKLFGSSFKYVTYVECDPGGKNPQPDLCQQKGVTSYPTWEINGEVESGEIPLPVLAEKSGCTLEKTP